MSDERKFNVKTNGLKANGLKANGYTVTERIGRGRYGVCFLARGPGGVKVVIKKFKPWIFKKNGEKNKFEAVILSSLDDKRVPELLGVINEPKSYCFVLEYKPGVTLKDMLFKYNHRFTAAEFYNVGLKLIEIIAYLHSRGVVHRDIRVPNVLLDGGEVYLIDFGLARLADGGKYRYELDFSYLGDLFLYLLYSSYEKGAGKKSRPWYEELPLTDGQKIFLKRLFALELNGAAGRRFQNPNTVDLETARPCVPGNYSDINDVKKDFEALFAVTSLSNPS